MSRGDRRAKAESSKRATEAFAAGMQLVGRNPALSALGIEVCRRPGPGTPKNGTPHMPEAVCPFTPDRGLLRVDSNGTVHVHPTRLADPDEWAWALAHGVLHLGFGHVPAAHGAREQPDRFDLAARCAVVNRFLLTFPVGRVPDDLPASYPDGDEEQLAARWRRDGIPAVYRQCGTAGSEPDQVLQSWKYGPYSTPTDWRTEFAQALTRTVSAAMDMAGGRRGTLRGARTARRPWDAALSWFISSYPLLGGIAAGMTVVADAELARTHEISVAAVDATAGEIYVNPLRRLTEEEWRFVLAHEMLHAALRHGDRCGARDPYLFNVAADYVINGWLREMDIGEMPEGLLHDPQLAGLSAEEVYDRITTDLRRMRRLATLRGKGRGDILGAPIGAPRDYTDLDSFYRRGLFQGYDLHTRQERGLLPAGLVEEIRALSHPPLPWDARLARWFDEYVPRPEPVRSYARPARRQAATPGIPRAGRYFPPEEIARCTFGVVLDTSGSMGRVLLGKALGAIASYAEARDVPAARVVFCDAAPHDAGYLPVTEIAVGAPPGRAESRAWGRVRVRGRGGTVLQPGVDLLQKADDFPPSAPVLVITDGYCDVLRVVRREHAYLVPQGAALPFTARGPVFRMR